MMSPCLLLSKKRTGRFCMPLNMAQRIRLRKPCVMLAISCVYTAMAATDTIYMPISSAISGMISARADAQSPLSYHFWITAMTFCVNMDGTAAVAADTSMHTAVSGTSFG